jgi:hypothetical protein
MRRLLWIATAFVWPCVAWSQANNPEPKPESPPPAANVQPPIASQPSATPRRPPLAVNEVRKPLPRRPPMGKAARKPSGKLRW